MKKILALILALAMVFALVACGKTEAPAETPAETPAEAPAEAPASTVNEYGYDVSAEDSIEVLLAHGESEAKTQSVYTAKFIELVEKYSDGKISFHYSVNGEMGTTEELVEALDNHVIDMSLTAIANFQSYVPEVGIMLLPFSITSWDQANNALDNGVADYLTKNITEKTNIIPLNYFPTAFMSFMTNREINSLADAQGMLTRCPGADSYLNLQNTLGLAPTVISFNETYNAMATGLVEATYSAVDTYYNNGYYQIGKYVWNTRDSVTLSSITANQDFWNDLPEVYRQIMTDAIAEITPEAREACASLEAEYIKGLQDEGVIFCEIDSYLSEIQALFEAQYKSTIESIGGEAQEIFDLILAS